MIIQDYEAVPTWRRSGLKEPIEVRIFLDIETAPSADADNFKPEFEPAANLKSEEAIERNLLAQERAWEDKKALNPLTGIVHTVSMRKYKRKFGEKEWEEVGPILFHPLTYDHLPAIDIEAAILKHLRMVLADTEASTVTIIGHNIKQFDLPFIRLRGFRHGISFEFLDERSPLREHTMLSGRTHPRYSIVDTMEIWNAGRYPKQYISLVNLGKFLGTENPEKEFDGKDYASVYETDYVKALLYAFDDVVKVENIYHKLNPTQ